MIKRLHKILLFWALLFSFPKTIQASEPMSAAILPMDKTLQVFSDLLHAKLSSHSEVALLEREHVDKVLDEWRISSLWGSKARASRISVGKLLRADILIVLSPLGEKGIRVTLAETRHGLRLLEEHLETSENEALDLATLSVIQTVQAFESCQGHAYSVPAFQTKTLLFAFDPYQEGLAVLLRRALLRRGRLVVEFEEAKEILNEVSTTEGPDVTRPGVTLVEGSFSAEGQNVQKLDVEIQVSSPPSQPQKLSLSLPIEPKDLQNHLHSLVNRILDMEESVLPEKGSTVSDSKSQSWEEEESFLTERGLMHARIGAMEEACQELEASLVLNPSSVSLRSHLFRIYQSRMQRWRTIKETQEHFEAFIPLALRALEYAEWVTAHKTTLTEDDWEAIHQLASNVGNALPYAPGNQEAQLEAKRMSPVADALQHLLLRVFERRELFSRTDYTQNLFFHFGRAESCTAFPDERKYQRRARLITLVRKHLPAFDLRKSVLAEPISRVSMEAEAYKDFLEGLERDPDPAVREWAWKRRMHATPKRLKSPATSPKSSQLEEASSQSSRRDPLKRGLENIPHKPVKKIGVPKDLLSLEPVLSDLEEELPLEGRRSLRKVMPCGENAESLSFNKSLYYLPSPSQFSKVFSLPSESEAIIQQAAWCEGLLWIVTGTYKEDWVTDDWTVHCWDKEKDVLHKWASAEGLPMSGSHQEKGSLSAVKLCPYGKKAIVAGVHRKGEEARSSWVSLLEPGKSGVELLWESRDLAHAHDNVRYGDPTRKDVFHLDRDSVHRDKTIIRIILYPPCVLLLDPETMRIEPWKQLDLPRSYSYRHLSCGESGFAKCINQLKLVFTASSLDSEIALSLPPERHERILDMSWDEKNKKIWLAIGPKSLAVPFWEVRSWCPETKELQSWRNERGLPAYLTTSKKGAKGTLQTLSYEGRTFVAGGYESPGATPRGWIGVMNAKTQRIELFWESKADEEASSLPDDLLRPFCPTHLYLKKADGQENRDKIVMGGRPGRNLCFDPETLEPSLEDREKPKIVITSDQASNPTEEKDEDRPQFNLSPAHAKGDCSFQGLSLSLVNGALWASSKDAKEASCVVPDECNLFSPSSSLWTSLHFGLLVHDKETGSLQKIVLNEKEARRILREEKFLRDRGVYAAETQ